MPVAVYGKAPLRGDFIERSAPDDFVECWHAWSVAGLGAAKAALNEEFAPYYVRAPLWRFALCEGVCGAAPAIGVMSPSVDSIGRYFPLTLFSHGESGINAIKCLSVNAAWFDEVEQLMLQMFSESADLDDFYSAGEAMASAAFATENGGAPVGHAFAPSIEGLAGLCAGLVNPSPQAAFWSVDGFNGEGSSRIGALFCRDALPGPDDWKLLLGARTGEGD